MDKRLCPIDGSEMKRDERPFEVKYRGHSETVSLPGWYCSCGESLHSKAEMKVADAALKRLKAKEKALKVQYEYARHKSDMAPRGQG